MTTTLHDEPPSRPVDTFLEFLRPAERQFFGLNADPFDLEEGPEDLFLSPALQEIQSGIMMAARRRNFVIVSAEAGAGKSCMLRSLRARLEANTRYKVIEPYCLDRRKITHTELAVSILLKLTHRDTGGFAAEARGRALLTALAEARESNLVLFVDEAHLMSDEGLLALKHIWDTSRSVRPMGVILAGQPSLEGRLLGPVMREVGIRARLVHLPELGDQTRAYLQWRFAQVEADADAVFGPDAYDALAKRGKHPLVLNSLAVRAMRYAKGMGDTIVCAPHVARA